MRNDCSSGGGWCLKAFRRGEYINRSVVEVLLCDGLWYGVLVERELPSL